MSDPVQVTSGVPQGSVLGPTLFILFINDIVDCVTNSTIRIFADDTLVYRPITNPNDMTLLQTDLDKLFPWDSPMLCCSMPKRVILYHSGNAFL